MLVAFFYPQKNKNNSFECTSPERKNQSIYRACVPFLSCLVHISWLLAVGSDTLLPALRNIKIHKTKKTKGR